MVPVIISLTLVKISWLTIKTKPENTLTMSRKKVGQSSHCTTLPTIKESPKNPFQGPTSITEERTTGPICQSFPCLPIPPPLD